MCSISFKYAREKRDKKALSKGVKENKKGIYKYQAKNRLHEDSEMQILIYILDLLSSKNKRVLLS